jgi:RND superfamily putative drug exporter
MVTLLPALLGRFGIRVLSRRQRGARAAGPPVRAGLLARWAAAVQRRPGILGAATVAVMPALAIPVLAIAVLSRRVGAPDQGNDPSSSTTGHAYDLLSERFCPGFNRQLLLVAHTVTSTDVAALHKLEAMLRQVPDVAAAATAALATAAAQAGTEVIRVVSRTSPAAKAASHLVAVLRSEVIPAAEHGTTLHLYVGGITATFADLASVTAAKLPWFLLAVLGFGFLLLVLAFRSLLIPATAAVLNLIATAAAFGVSAASFRWGWGSGALGLGEADPIEARHARAGDAGSPLRLS